LAAALVAESALPRVAAADAQHIAIAADNGIEFVLTWKSFLLRISAGDPSLHRQPADTIVAWASCPCKKRPELHVARDRLWCSFRWFLQLRPTTRIEGVVQAHFAGHFQRPGIAAQRSATVEAQLQPLLLRRRHRIVHQRRPVARAVDRPFVEQLRRQFPVAAEARKWPDCHIGPDMVDLP
jgi:hypothetical protein